MKSAQHTAWSHQQVAKYEITHVSDFYLDVFITFFFFFLVVQQLSRKEDPLLLQVVKTNQVCSLIFIQLYN